MKGTKNILLLTFILLTQIGYSLNIGSAAPEIKLKTFKGEEASLSSLKGKVVLVDFWASWCHPCREANPFLVEAYLKYHHKGFEIMSVSLDDNKSHWLNAIESDKLPWDLHVSDLNGWASQVVKDYSVQALPTSYLVGRDGKIVAVDPFAEDLELELEEIFMEELSFYPKRATTKLYLSLATKYVIRDKDRKKVVKSEGEVIDVSFLDEGLYYIEFGGKEEKFLKKGLAQESAKILSQNNKKITFSETLHYEIHEIHGEMLKEGNGEFVDISALDDGEYYIHLNGKVERFIKNSISSP